MQVLLEHREDVKLESTVVARDYLTVFERCNGQRSAIVYQLPKVQRPSYIQCSPSTWRVQIHTVEQLQKRPCQPVPGRLSFDAAGWRDANRAGGRHEARV